MGEADDMIVTLAIDAQRRDGTGWVPTHARKLSTKVYRMEGVALDIEKARLVVVYSTTSGVWYTYPKAAFDDQFEELSEESAKIRAREAL